MGTCKGVVARRSDSEESRWLAQCQNGLQRPEGTAGVKWGKREVESGFELDYYLIFRTNRGIEREKDSGQGGFKTNAT